MRFSIIVPTYNRKNLLRCCLAATTNQDYPDFEVIVVDDGSTDGTEEMVRQEFPYVRYFRQEVNQGPAAARNRGIREATGELIAFTDDDCEPPPEWLSRLQQGFKAYPEVGAVGGIQEAPDALLQNNLFARYERFVTRQIYKVGTHPVKGQPAPGGTNNLAVPRDVLQRLGGFDEYFPVAAGEDADLLHRIAKTGYFTVALPAKVLHHQPYVWRSFVKQQIRRGVGSFYFWSKHGQPHQLAHDLARILLTPWVFFKTLAQHHQVRMALVHSLGGALQAWGRIQAGRRSSIRTAFWWKASYSPLKLHYLQWVRGSTVLDIGTGRGFYSSALQDKGFQVVGVDLPPVWTLSIPVIVARISALPFGKPFDTVLALDVLEHEEDEDLALQELRRLTKQRLILSVPNIDHSRLIPYNLTYKHHIDKTHYREYDVETLQTKIELAGFRPRLIRKEGPVHPAVFSEFIRPSWLRAPVRVILRGLFRLKILDNPDLRADIYVVAEVVE